MAARSKKRRRTPQSDISRVLHQLVDGCKDPAQFIELFYWSQEQQLAEFMRAFVALPDEAKYTLHAFLHLAEANLKSVSATINDNGDVTLSSATVTSVLSAAQTPLRSKPSQAVH